MNEYTEKVHAEDHGENSRRRRERRNQPASQLRKCLTSRAAKLWAGLRGF